MLTSEFDYTLPPELIAQRPLAQRDAARMMVVERASETMNDGAFRDLQSLLIPGLGGYQWGGEFAIPEPSAMALMSLGLLTLLRRR